MPEGSDYTHTHIHTEDSLPKHVPLAFENKVSLCSPIGQELTRVATQIDLEFMVIPVAQPSQL